MSAPPGARRVPLSGELGTTSLAEVLQTLEMRKTTAKVRIEGEMGAAEVEVVEGKIVHASMGELDGWGALLAMLGIADGHFEVVEMAIEPRPSVVPSVGALIAEKERRILEWRQLSERAPPLSSVLKPTPSAAEAAQDPERPAHARRLLSLLDGQRTLAEIIEESGVDAVEALGLLIAAITDGLARADAPQLSLFPLAAAPEGSFAPDEPKRIALSGGDILRRKTVIGMGLDLSEVAETARNEAETSPPHPAPGPEAPSREVRRADVQRIISVTAARPEAVPVPKRRSRSSVTPSPQSVAPVPADGPPSAPASMAPGTLALRPASDPPEQKARGRRYIGRYEVLCRIGSGGMGSVYLSRLTSEIGFRRLFALKVLRSHLLEDSAAAQKFLEEARLAGYIHHPNVVSVVDAGIEGSQPFLAMDYVEGGSLKQLLSADPTRRPPELIVPVVLDALSGLHAAHQLETEDGTPLNLVHSDVSPENLMVGVDGVCRLTDFGVAKPGGLQRRNEAAHGKPGYMAPEQITGGRIDRRADIFAMGVLLYNSLTGTKLFEAQTIEETLRQVLACRIPAPSTVGLKPTPALDLICVRALDRDPSRRFETAEEMMLELRRVALRESLLAPTNA
ncbi:MAG TPA: protein kinase, partial [Polyangiaceae bacterium]